MSQAVPYPPIETFGAVQAQLRRPEDVAFTPDGDLMVVANAEGDSITIYRRSSASEKSYAPEPVQILQDHVTLQYVHGVDISADGRFLAAVSRERHCLSLYSRSNNAESLFEPEPLWVMVGEQYGLCYPTGVAFHPTGRNLVVCNRMQEPSIAFFVRAPGHAGHYGYSARRSISPETFLGHGLAASHTLTYTPDGRFLAICHNVFFKSPDQRGESGISILAWDEATNTIRAEVPLLVYPTGSAHMHSLAFHPLQNCLGVTSCDSDTILFRCSNPPHTLEPLLTINHPRKTGEEGPKGIRFNRDGQRVTITNAQHELSVYELPR